MMEVLGAHPRDFISKVTFGKAKSVKWIGWMLIAVTGGIFLDLIILGDDPGLVVWAQN